MGLVEDNVRLAARAAAVAHRKYRRYLDEQVCLPLNYDDWLSEMNLALVRSAKSFSPERGEFKNYASRAMNNSVCNMWRTDVPRYHNCWYAAVNKERRRISDQDRMASDGAGDDTKEYVASLKSKAGLNWKQRIILVLIYQEGYKGVEIAEMMGVSKTAITEAHWRAVEKMRLLLEEGS